MANSLSGLLDVHDLLGRTQIAPGMHIADFGAGQTGHLVFPAAQIIGEHGIVYAVDILPDVLAEIKKRAASNSCLQIKPVWADIEMENGVSIPKDSLDVVFIVNVLHGAKKMNIVLAEADRVLKSKGRLVIVDWVKKVGALGPEQNDQLDFNVIISWARERAYAVQEDFSVSEYSRGLILFKHD